MLKIHIERDKLSHLGHFRYLRKKGKGAVGDITKENGSEIIP